MPRRRAGAVGAFVAGALVCACAALAIPVQYGAAEDRCTAEASTRAADDDCRCRVRAQYPSAPQCISVDGGWILPPRPVFGDGAVR